MINEEELIETKALLKTLLSLEELAEIIINHNHADLVSWFMNTSEAQEHAIIAGQMLALARIIKGICIQVRK